MTIVVRSPNEDTIHLTPLDQFLTLRGALQEDDAFDAAMEFLDQAWQSWAMFTPSQFLEEVR